MLLAQSNSFSSIQRAHCKCFHTFACLKTKKKSSSSNQWLARQANDHYVNKSKLEGFRSRSSFKILEMDEKYKLIESCYKNILKSYANQIKNSESADSNISLQHTAFNNLNQLVNKGMVILDCGASPGGWSQAIVKKNTDFIRSRAFQSNTKSVLQKLSLCENMPIDNDSSAKHLDHSSIIAVDLLPMASINGVEFICGDFLEGSVQEQIRKSIDGRLVGLILSDMAPSLSGIKVVDSEKSMDLCKSVIELAKQFLHPGGALVMKYFMSSSEKELLKILKTEFASVNRVKPLSSRKESSESYFIASGRK